METVEGNGKEGLGEREPGSGLQHIVQHRKGWAGGGILSCDGLNEHLSGQLMVGIPAVFLNHSAIYVTQSVVTNQ